MQTGCFRNLWKYRLVWMPPAALALAVVLHGLVWQVARFTADHILFCPFYELTGYYCPGCGGTRSILALIHGHPLLALHENPWAVGLVLVVLLWYIERIAALFGKTVRLFPRALSFWLTVCGIIIAWGIVRNFVPAMMPVT